MAISELRPLVRYWRCFSIGKCRSVRSVCPLFGIRRLSAIWEQKMYIIIAVGTSTAVRYSEEVRYWEGPLSEVPLYINGNSDRLDHQVSSLPLANKWKIPTFRTTGLARFLSPITSR